MLVGAARARASPPYPSATIVTQDKHNILIVGGGGREHALAWKVAQSPRAGRVYVAPGNGGTAMESGVENVPILATDVDALVRFARDRQIDLTIVGPEAPLVAGIVDAFTAAGLRCFGPTRAAARLEGSKAFAKDFMIRHGIPTAKHRTFSNLDEALAYLQEIGAPVVVKADGLAAGKGVVLAETLNVAQAAVHQMLSGERFGAAGRTVVIEQWLRGRELSFIALLDGTSLLPLASSQDHKARDAGGRGPNTGGMGAFSPSPLMTPDLERCIMSRIMQPTMRGLEAEGMRYLGFLYAGLMIDDTGEPRVLEYNCRLGDPETQPILMRLRSDLLELIEAAMAGQLGQVEATWHPDAALGVVLAAGGYPDRYETGTPLTGEVFLQSPHVKVFHAGTKRADSGLVSDGGRVLCATALGKDLEEARRRAYGALAGIGLRGGFHRSDIGLQTGG
jgi:phosphoribosylamine--glycine ligase